MARETYWNGDPISLQATGCDGCSPLTVNGMFLHERGCKEAWRDHRKRCYDCDSHFYSKTSVAHASCPSCEENYNRLYAKYH